MNKYKIFNLIFLIIISGCCNKPKNLSLAKKEVEQYYLSGCYKQDLKEAIKKAKKQFSKPAKNNNEVVIFDIDETALTDYKNFKDINFGYIPKLSNEWILCSCAKKINETYNFYKHLKNLGYKIIFLTGRKYHEYDATYKNLIDQGYTNFEKLIVRSKEEENLTAKEYKSKQRTKLTNQGYKIVGSIGDQESDISGPYVGKGIKLPNYIYKID